MSSSWSLSWTGGSGGGLLQRQQSQTAVPKTMPRRPSDWTTNKEEAIRTCLQGDDGQAVNLWQLRTLTLERGGLVSHEWRKRAWPKLVGSWDGAAVPPHKATLAVTQLVALQTDLRTTVWNVEGELRKRKEARLQEQAEMDALVEEERLRNRRVKFALNNGSESDGTPPDVTFTTPTNSQDEAEEESLSGRFSYTEHHGGGEGGGGSSSPNTVATFETGTTVSLLSNSSISSSSRANRGRKATVHEQRVLYTLIKGLLQHSPYHDDHENDEEDHKHQPYTYHPGFQDLVSLLLYNLESPTVTSMVLPKLATHHWRYLLSSKSQLEGFLSATFMPLLEQLDARLAQHLQTQGLRLPTFCRSWFATWFASDTGYSAAASRILDVLLVSHPFTAVYLSVAWVIQSRVRLLALTDFCDLAKTLRRLPLEATNMEDDVEFSLEVVEDVIARTLGYMEKIPPHRLVALVQNLSSVTLDASLPEWSLRDVAPNDWAILAKRWNVTPVVPVDRQAFPLACVAMGQAVPKGKPKFMVGAYKGIMLLLILGLVAMACGGWCQYYYPFWPVKPLPLEYLPSASSRLTRFSRKSRVLHPSLASVATYYDEASSSSSTGVVLFSATSGAAATPQSERVPWWKRFRRAVDRLLDHLWFWEHWLHQNLH